MQLSEPSKTQKTVILRSEKPFFRESGRACTCIHPCAHSCSPVATREVTAFAHTNTHTESKRAAPVVENVG